MARLFQARSGLSLKFINGTSILKENRLFFPFLPGSLDPPPVPGVELAAGDAGDAGQGGGGWAGGGHQDLLRGRAQGRTADGNERRCALAIF